MIANVQHWTELISKRLSGNIREDDARMLDAWVARDAEHREYYENLLRVWEVSVHAVENVPLPDADWANLEARMSTPASKLRLPHITVPNVSLPYISVRRMAIAASILLVAVVGAAIWYQVQNNRLAHTILAEAGDNSTFEVVLPDGSKVTLRQGSTLSYDRDFDSRDVSLSGEAFFSVARDEEKPFSITAANGTVRVLGTKFNLKAEEGVPVELFVEEGRVAFSPTSQKYDAKIFSTGQAGILNTAKDAEVERTAASGQNITSWVTGRLVFDHTPLDHVITDIARHFSVAMTADSSLYACELKADFTHATLDNVLETLSFSLNLQIEKSGDTYVISGEPCATDTEN
jgi:ferric-dicitrate binding protein FerR (iron transport regulator)